MAEKIVAADSSPLIGLAAAGAFHLLHELFGIVTITRAVQDEVMAGAGLPGSAELTAGIEAGWITVVRNPGKLTQFPELGAGEASTLALAQSRGGECLVVMDEWLGRARARELGIPVTGLAGVLLAGKEAGMLERIAPLLERLAVSQFRLAEGLIKEVLREAGET